MFAGSFSLQVPHIPLASKPVSSPFSMKANAISAVTVFMAEKKDEKKGEKKTKEVGVGSFDVPPIRRYGPFPPAWKKSVES
mmetsp:Transcript_21200/g.36418  ORF Transcript_21200/g.36418 Transcript_21200/m.36418 type:complete len:81 (-) Transcript_21200:612-854(-)|eukprot:CAMPEP_0196652112 /NCGR_PEP_ID=MMETSP1086-20130531/1328_1 /TAXON_ID=77921 /ORGANISM="Cyanoptyche  gloeocystis , Strain SAG4.97" /LENGTH=80 /DNA_ID=CAMNT_0041982489 /DNA_START=129 /DNA_END=371 /DNA_ORIENTATION=-